MTDNSVSRVITATSLFLVRGGTSNDAVKNIYTQPRKGGAAEERSGFRNEERKSKKTDLVENEEGDTGSSPDLEKKAREGC